MRQILVILLLTITLISSWCSGPELIDIIFMIKIDLFQMLLTAIIYSSVKYILPPIMIFDYFHLAGLSAHVLVLLLMDISLDEPSHNIYLYHIHVDAISQGGV